MKFGVGSAVPVIFPGGTAPAVAGKRSRSYGMVFRYHGVLCSLEINVNPVKFIEKPFYHKQNLPLKFKIALG